MIGYRFIVQLKFYQCKVNVIQIFCFEETGNIVYLPSVDKRLVSSRRPAFIFFCFPLFFSSITPPYVSEAHTQTMQYVLLNDE